KGILFGVVAAILSAVFTILNKRVANNYPARSMVFYEMTAGWLIVSLVIAGLLLSGHPELLMSEKTTTGSLVLVPGG
ncbi:hypothetical protein OFN94_43835, partial [Escherichia coli]|nr:hypothetical protein [Escherichia coli]